MKNPGNLCSIISLVQVVKWADFLRKACEQASKPEARAIVELIRCLNTSQDEQPALQHVRDLVAKHIPSKLAKITDKGGFRSHQCVADVFKAIFQDEVAPLRQINCFDDDDITNKLAELTRQVRSDQSGSFAVIETTEYTNATISYADRRKRRRKAYSLPNHLTSAAPTTFIN